MLEDFPIPKPNFEARQDFEERLNKLRNRIKYMCLEIPINCDCVKCKRIDEEFKKFFEEAKENGGLKFVP